MSYQEKNITVSLVSHLFILTYYLANLFPIIRSGEWIANKLYALWAIVIGVNILVTIIGSILTNIVLTIVEAVKSRKYEDPRFITDPQPQSGEIPMNERLFTPVTVGRITLANRIVMAPMTRSRAVGNVPNALIEKFYADRSAAGLLITEGVAPSPDGLGYARIPGLFSDEQERGWKRVTDAVHRAGGRIFAQLMHTGRVGHPANMPAGSRIVAPSAVALAGDMWTDEGGMQPHPVPAEMTEADIAKAIGEFAAAARRAIAAGFDGVELHGANGYLIDQFLNTASNRRTDRWGGSVGKMRKYARFSAKATG